MEDSKKTFKSFSAHSVSMLAKAANERGLTKEDIVQAINNGKGDYFILYYK